MVAAKAESLAVVAIRSCQRFARGSVHSGPDRRVGGKVESQSFSSRIMAQATTPILRARAMPAFLRRLFEPPWIRVNVSLLQRL